MARFEPCGCQETRCFRCAVGFVIQELGFNEECECFGSRGNVCKNRCGRLRSDWKSSIAMASSTSTEWARRRAVRVGLKVKRLLVKHNGEELDITDPALMEQIPPSALVFGVFKIYDPLVALDRLIEHVEEDPLSYDAIRLVIGDLIKCGATIPEQLREKVAAIVTGETARPKGKGKQIGATLARDKLLYRLIREVTSVWNLDPTSSAQERGLSACNAVAEGFRLLGLLPNSYSHMEKVWLKRGELSIFSTDED